VHSGSTLQLVATLRLDSSLLVLTGPVTLSLAQPLENPVKPNAPETRRGREASGGRWGDQGRKQSSRERPRDAALERARV